MKLHLLDRAASGHSSFTIHTNRHPYFLKVWHYHVELELVYILKSKGMRFVGDSIEKFEEGELVLIGKNLPHMWLNDEVYFDKKSDLVAEAIALHFTDGFLGQDFLKAPEMQSISELFDRAEQGIRFVGIAREFGNELQTLSDLKGFRRIMKFLELLHFLAKHKKYELLSSKGFLVNFHTHGNEKLDKVYAFIYKNFKDPIRSKDAAEVAHMNSSAFSRYFKRMHRKTFTKFLNEIRIGFACKQLMKQKENVSTICYESGFNNISNFNRQFRAIVGMSPTDYIQRHTLE